MWRRNVQCRLKCRHISTRLHGVISQNTATLNWLLTVETSVWTDGAYSLWTVTIISIADVIQRFVSDSRWEEV